MDKNTPLLTKLEYICDFLNNLVDSGNIAELREVIAVFNEEFGGAYESSVKLPDDIVMFLISCRLDDEASKEALVIKVLRKDYSLETVMDFNVPTEYISFKIVESLNEGVFEVYNSWGCNPCPCIFRALYVPDFKIRTKI